MVGPSRRREAVERARERVEVSERRACGTLRQPRSTQRYQPRPRGDEPRLVAEIHRIVRAHPRYGTPRVYHELRRRGWKVNHKRVERLWRKEGLKAPPKAKKRRHCGSSANSCVQTRAERPNDVWTWDFIFDRLENGRQVKWLTLVDEFTRESLLLHPSHSIRAKDAIDLFGQVVERRGPPAAIRSDNGPEFIAEALRQWLAQAGVETLYIAPGAPWENGFAEAFNSRFRDEFLSTELFTTLLETQVLTRDYREHYNKRRPHSSLGYLAPEAFAEKWRNEHRRPEETNPQGFSPPRGRTGKEKNPSLTDYCQLVLS